MMNRDDEEETTTTEEETPEEETSEEETPAPKAKKAKAKKEKTAASPFGGESRPIHVALSIWKRIKRYAKAKNLTTRDAADHLVDFALKRKDSLDKYSKSSKEALPPGKPRKKQPAGEKRAKATKRQAKKRRIARENQ